GMGARLALGIAESFDEPPAFRMTLHAQGVDDLAGFHVDARCVSGTIALDTDRRPIRAGPDRRCHSVPRAASTAARARRTSRSSQPAGDSAKGLAVRHDF